MGAETPGKMIRIGPAHLDGDFGNGLIRAPEEKGGLFGADPREIGNRGKTERLVKEPSEVGNIDMEFLRQPLGSPLSGEVFRKKPESPLHHRMNRRRIGLPFQVFGRNGLPERGEDKGQMADPMGAGAGGFAFPSQLGQRVQVENTSPQSLARQAQPNRPPRAAGRPAPKEEIQRRLVERPEQFIVQQRRAEAADISVDMPVVDPGVPGSGTEKERVAFVEGKGSTLDLFLAMAFRAELDFHEIMGVAQFVPLAVGVMQGDNRSVDSRKRGVPDKGWDGLRGGVHA